MRSIKREAAALIERMPDDCSVEDIRYQLYVLGKVRDGLKRNDTEGAIEQDEAEVRLGKMACSIPLASLNTDATLLDFS
jgi:hypothetical protein